jgi:uncharacterized membrane-anchored protein
MKRGEALKPDAYDMMAGIGLIILAIGLWLVYEPLALIVVGGILLALGVYLARKRAE